MIDLEPVLSSSCNRFRYLFLSPLSVNRSLPAVCQTPSSSSTVAVNNQRIPSNSRPPMGQTGSYQPTSLLTHLDAAVAGTMSTTTSQPASSSSNNTNAVITLARSHTVHVPRTTSHHVGGGQNQSPNSGVVLRLDNNSTSSSSCVTENTAGGVRFSSAEARPTRRREFKRMLSAGALHTCPPGWQTATAPTTTTRGCKW